MDRMPFDAGSNPKHIVLLNFIHGVGHGGIALALLFDHGRQLQHALLGSLLDLGQHHVGIFPLPAGPMRRP